MSLNSSPVELAGPADPKTTKPGPKYPIESVDNALRLLFLVSERGSIGISDASAELGIGVSTVHRLFAMLSHYRLTVQDAELRSYGIGPALTELGFSALRNLHIPAAAHQAMVRIVEEVDETVHLVQLHGMQIAFLDCVECSRPLRAVSRIGELLPAHITASGRALLAALPEEESADFIAHSGPLQTRTDGTEVTHAELLDELAQIRGRGWAENHGESSPDLYAVAVAILDSSGRAHGALTVAAPPHRMGEDETRRISEALMRAAAFVSSTLP